MAEADPYQGQEGGAAVFGKRFEVITPHDTNVLKPYKAIIVGGTGGNVVVHNHADVSITLLGIAGMALQGVRPKRILTTTVATPLIGIL
jgi:hypothetical protein